jgi:hypothetical protein
VDLVSLNFKKIFILIAFLGVSYANSDSSTAFCEFGSKYISSWIPTSLIVILTVITVLSFLYSLSPFLGGYGRRLKIQLKEEFVQVAISIFLISSIVLVLKPSCDLLKSIGSMLYQPGDPFLQSEIYLQFLLIKGINLYAEGYLYEIRFFILSNLVGNVPQLGWISQGESSQVALKFGGIPTSGPFISMLNTLDSIINAFVTVAFSSIFILLLIVEFSEMYAFQLILPLGIICRVVPQLRRGADFFIALSIGLYIFLPALMIMNSYLTTKVISFQLETPQSAKDLQEYLSPTSQVFNSLNIALSTLDFMKVLNFNNFLQEIAWYTFFAIFMLGMDIALVMAFVETLANALSIGFGSLTIRLREAYAPG